MKGRRADEEGGNQGECGVSRRPKRVLTKSPFLPFMYCGTGVRLSHLYTIWCARYLAAVRPSALIPTRQLPAPPYLSVTPLYSTFLLDITLNTLFLRSNANVNTLPPLLFLRAGDIVLISLP
ncbi:hypothetical protein QL285_084512 [Trifolium repens]|nr:hypothetical protein QL285_084512 [Trifolium repens]